MDKDKSIEVTETMLDAGMDEFMEYELGGMTAEEMIRRVFVSMLSAAPSNLAPDSKDREPH